MKISVVGTGYVGLVTGACFADFGLDVVCVDKDKDKIDMLNDGRIPIYEPGLAELVKKNVSEGRLSFSTDISGSIKDALVVFIAVGTPPLEDGSADLSFVKRVASTIADNLNGHKVVVTKSTVPVGTGRLLEGIIRGKCGEDAEFDIVSNPEFLREGSAVEDFMRPNRVVIGADSGRAIDIMKELYSPLYLIDTPFVIASVKTAEMIKYASNAFLATKISFINEMARICEESGADIQLVSRGMGLDKRIGPKFLHPGPGYGGSCFPKDTAAIARIAKEHGCTFEIVEAVIRVNQRQRGWMFEKIKRAVGGAVSGKTIGILGLTFKPNTDDIRESPAIAITGMLLEEGAEIRVYDPAGLRTAEELLTDTVVYCSDSYEVCSGSDAIVVMTEWNQFRRLDLQRVASLMRTPVFIDFRNIYEPSEVRSNGFKYIAVGRGAAR